MNEEMSNELLFAKALSEYAEPYVNESDFSKCPHCQAGAYGFVEHRDNCIVLVARGVLGLCPHGYTANYNHSNRSCPAVKKEL